MIVFYSPMIFIIMAVVQLARKFSFFLAFVFLFPYLYYLSNACIRDVIIATQ